MSGRRVHIIGAGFSGLTLAYFLARAGVHVDVFEKSERAGGLIHTDVTDWGVLETAANGLLQSPLVAALFHDLGIKYAKPDSMATRSRYIFRGKPKKWPLSIFESAILAKGLATFALKRDEKILESTGQMAKPWLSELFGARSFDYLFGPALQGVMGTNDLSASSVAQFLADALQRFSIDGLLSPSQKEEFTEYFSAVKGFDESDIPTRGTVSPENGMGQLIDSLVEKIKSLGGTVQFNSSGDWRASHPTVLALPAPAAALMVNDSAPDLARALSQVSYIPLTMANIGFAKKPTSEIARGFGCLFPQTEGFGSLGVLFSSSATHTESWIISGADQTDTQLLQMIAKDRSRLLNTTEKIQHSRITRWPYALPHYNLHLSQMLEKLPAILSAVPGLYLTGNYLGSIGLGRILAYNQRLSQRIRREQDL